MKERLVGAAVLMAAAIILIPEMLSGPQRRDAIDASAEQDEPFKTVTIDLNRPPGSPAVVEESAPPPEVAVGAPVRPEQAPRADSESAVSSENPPSATQVSPEQNASAPARPSATDHRAAEATRQPPTTAREPASEPRSSPPVASRPAVPTSRGWAVQLGSFSSRATAERLSKDFSEAGYDAFVMPVQSGGNTLYRVRVGPFTERAAANDALSAIKKRVANAAVVAHP